MEHALYCGHTSCCHSSQGGDKGGLLSFHTFSQPRHDLLTGFIPPSFPKDLLGDLGHLPHFGLGVLLDQTHLLAEILSELVQFRVGVNGDLLHLLLPNGPVLVQFPVCVLPQLRDVVLGLNAKALQLADGLFPGLGVLDGPQRGILLQLFITHGVERLDFRNGIRAHLLKFLYERRVQAASGELVQNILPLAELLDLALQVLHQGLAANLFPFLDLVKEAVRLVQAVGAGLQFTLILVIQVLDVLRQPVIDFRDLVGILLLQVEAFLVCLLLDPLHILLILHLGLINLLFDPIDLPVHLLTLFGAHCIPALDTLISRKLVGKAHSAVILFLLDPVHRGLVGLLHQLIAQGVDLPVNFLAFLTALNVPGLHPLVGGQFLLGAEAVVVFLLLDPIDGGLISGCHQLILKTIDLPVDLLALLRTSDILLLKIFPPGQLVF